MPGILGRKVGMTSVFGQDGQNLAVTVIEAGPCVVTQVKTKESDGYKAVQIAFGLGLLQYLLFKKGHGLSLVLFVKGNHIG